MEIESILVESLDPYMLGVLISLAIGLILGLEREYDKQKGELSIAGLRTFPIVAIIGYMVGFLAESFSGWFLIFVITGFIIFMGLGQLSKTRNDAGFGLTTNLALIATFIMGLMVSQGLYRDSVATAVIVVTLLSLKSTFRSIIQNITMSELFAFVKFAIIALLILPFLPNIDFGKEGLLNPFEIGTIVVIVSFLNFIGYFLVKFVGSRKGILLTGILGGFISSTAVTWNYSQRSKENPVLSKEYGAGIIIASAIMFPRLLLLAGIFNPAIIKELLLPMFILTAVSIVPAILTLRKNTNNAETEIELGNPLDVLNAMGFAVIYIAILFAVHYGNLFLGESGLYLSSLIAGLADTTAITVSMAKFALNDSNLSLAALVIIAATLSNTLVKLVIVNLRANKNTARIISIIFGITIIIGFLYIYIKS